MKCKPKKYANGGPVRVFADGGTVGKPTYLKSVAAKVGIGDGYNYFPSKTYPKPKDKDADKRLTISNAPSKFAETLAKRKKAMDP